jgi:hypothetical protein
MNKEEMQAIAQRIGVLVMKKSDLEAEIKELKKKIEPHMKRMKTEDTNDGRVRYILDGVNGFTCKSYEVTVFNGSPTIGRKLLHPNTFNAIFKPTTYTNIDIRPTKETKRIGYNQFILNLENEIKEAS